MPPVMSALLAFVVALFRSRAALCLENLAPFPIPCRTLSEKPRTTAAGGHLQAGGASPAAPPD